MGCSNCFVSTPAPAVFCLSGLAMTRRDFEVRNQRGLKLVCTQWRPSFTEDTSKLPCVVYLHGNSSARVDVVKTRSLAVRRGACMHAVAAAVITVFPSFPWGTPGLPAALFPRVLGAMNVQDVESYVLRLFNSMAQPVSHFLLLADGSPAFSFLTSVLFLVDHAPTVLQISNRTAFTR